jgi:hypothetical protein
VQKSAALTSTLLKYHVALKLESILDKETKISHAMFAAQVEARLGSGEGGSAKGPDMKVWNRGKGLKDVCISCYAQFTAFLMLYCRSTGSWLNFAIPQSSSRDLANLAMICDIQLNPATTTLHTRVYFWYLSDYATNLTVPMSAEPSLWIRIQYVICIHQCIHY